MEHQPIDPKKKWYENKKEEILKKQNQIVECRCGVTVSLVNLRRHEKTRSHIEKLSKIRGFTKCKPDVVLCNCGTEVLRCNLYNHRKTKTHLSYLADTLVKDFNKMDF